MPKTVQQIVRKRQLVIGAEPILSRCVSVAPARKRGGFEPLDVDRGHAEPFEPRTDLFQVDHDLCMGGSPQIRS
jgi:hypothetical protein